MTRHNQNWVRYAILFLTLSATAVAPARAQAPDPRAARQENRLGLADHKAERFTESRAHFEQALQLDPTNHNIRFNAACAASRGGDVPGAKAHLMTFLEEQPEQAIRILHDSDLDAVLRDAAFTQALRATIRPAGTTVREILFERRDVGELFVGASDGLDVQAITRTENERPHSAEFAEQGRYIVFRSRLLRGGNGSQEANFIAPWYRHRDRYNEDLRAMAYPDGPSRTIGQFVRHHQVSPDGTTVFFVTNPNNKLPWQVFRSEIAGGTPSLVMELPVLGDDICIQEEESGALLVAAAYSIGWGSVVINLFRAHEGEVTLLFERNHLTRNRSKFFGIWGCQLSGDGKTLDLGSAVFHLDEEIRFETFPKPAGIPGTIVTASSTSHEQDMAPPERWRVHPLSYPSDGFGMSDVLFWQETRLFRTEPDRTFTRLSPADAFIEYAGSVSADGSQLLFTKVREREARPWVMLAKVDGSDAKPMFPGQFASWTPHEHTAQGAGASFEFGAVDSGSEQAAEAEARAEPDHVTEARGNEARGNEARGNEASTATSGCGCSTWGTRHFPAPLGLVLFFLYRKSRR